MYTDSGMKKKSFFRELNDSTSLHSRLFVSIRGRFANSWIMERLVSDQPIAPEANLVTPKMTKLKKSASKGYKINSYEHTLMLIMSGVLKARNSKARGEEARRACDETPGYVYGFHEPS
jgi:hypothetical protein